MDLFGPWAFLIAALLVLLLFILHPLMKMRRIYNKIPGPPTKPIIGNLMDLLLPLEEHWLRMRSLGLEYYPIFKMWTFHIPSVNFLDPDDIEVLLSTSKHTQKSRIYKLLEPWLGTGLLTSAGAKWQRRRKILTPAFHFNILQQFVNVFREQSAVLVERFEEECEKPFTDVVPIVTEYTLKTICETAMGFRLNPRETTHKNYVKAVYKVGELILHRLLRPWYFNPYVYSWTPQSRELNQAVTKLHGFSTDIIEERKTNHGGGVKFKDEDDFGGKTRMAMLDLLIIAQKLHGTIDDEGIREEVDTFMFEGHDTTSMGISFALLALANNQKVQKRVADELEAIFGDSNRHTTFQDLQNMNYLEMTLKESLRMYPSVPFISRVTDEEFTTPSGHTIPENTLSAIPIYDLHHNPRFYPEPEIFDPDRFLPENTQKRHPFAYLPFSAGPRNCIGQKFAMLEMKSAVSAVLRKFVLEPIDGPTDIVIMPDLVLRSKNGIKIKFRRRK